MRNYLIILLLFLACAYNVHAQCDPKQYTQILSEAQTLQQQGQFIEAKNKYEAAKIYACGAKDLDKADKAVDALFEQINRLREQADSTSLTAYANDLAYKSKVALRDGNLNEAMRLAEFAHRYVEPDNITVIQALMDALYYNDLAPKPLPRVENLEGHTSYVKSAVFSPDGNYLATASVDHNAKIWELKTAKAIATFKGHNGAVLCLAFSPDGKYLATGSIDSTAKVWSIETGMAIVTFKGHSAPVLSVCFSPDGKLLATGAHMGDNTAKIWNLSTGKIQTTLEGHRGEVSSVAFSPNGKRLATGSGDRTVKIWELSPQKELMTLELYGYRVASIAFSPACSADPEGGKYLATGASDHKALIWDLETGEHHLTLKGHSGRVTSVAYSPDGKRLATGSEDKTVKVWDLNTEEILLNLNGHTTPITSVTFSPICAADSIGGKHIATTAWENAAKIWDLDPDKALVALNGHTSSITGIDFSPDGKQLASASLDHLTKIWDLDSGKALATLAGHTDAVKSVAYAPDGLKLATTSWDSTVIVWDLPTQRPSTVLRCSNPWGYKNAKFSPDGKWLAAWSLYDSITILNLATLKVDKTLEGTCLTFLPPPMYSAQNRGQRIAIGTIENRVKILNFETLEVLNTLEGFSTAVKHIVCSPDGRFLATEDGDQTKIWDLKTGKARTTLDGEIAAFSPAYTEDPGGGKRVATEVNRNLAKVWDLETSSALTIAELQTSEIGSLAFSPDGEQLATGSSGFSTGNCVIKIWDLTAEKLLSRWQTGGKQAGLTLVQLQQYNLQSLLSLHPDNEQKLIATQEIWQIKAFADLAALKAAASNILVQVEPHFLRAERLYTAALALQSEPLIRMDYAKMLRSWAQVCQSEGLEEKARELRFKADAL